MNLTVVKKRTALAYVLTRVLETPFWGIFNLLPFILYKDLAATPFQIAVMIALKPLTSIFSSYWSHRIHLFPERVLSSILSGRLIAFLPFFLFPFIHSSWLLIGCYGLFMFLQVGMIPSWMEILKKNLPPKTHEKVFSYSQAFGYLGGGLLPFALGWILDEWQGSWRWIFPLASLIALTAYFWQKRILLLPEEKNEPSTKAENPLLHPWKNAWNLLKERADFAKFQIGFMLLGGGLMIFQPALPAFFVDRLNLSYVTMGIAITLCKGIGFAGGSPLWIRSIRRFNPFYFGAIISTLAALFTLILLASEWHSIFLYLAYLLYGFMQSGNELSWNLSGPLFSKESDSSPFSRVNIIAVGIRGLFIPALGAFILSQFGSFFVILSGGVLCSLAAIRMMLYSREGSIEKTQSLLEPVFKGE